MTKWALSRIMQHLRQASPEQVAAFFKKAPPSEGSHYAHKLLAGRAAEVVKGLPESAGHGPSHIWNVTRTTQRLMRGLDPRQRQRATMSALLHDVGREAEGTLKKIRGKGYVATTPEAQHAVLGGHFTKAFFRRNRDVSRFLPHSYRKGVVKDVTVHDTDVHKLLPWAERYVATHRPSAAVYLADKADALGRRGALRTIQMGKKFGETPEYTAQFALRQIPKYQGIIDRYARGPQREILIKKLDEYRRLMEEYGRTGVSPVALPKAASLEKLAMSAVDYEKLFRWALRSGKPEKLLPRYLPRLNAAGGADSDLINGLFRLPVSDRIRVIRALGKATRQFL